jgi:cyclopropane-fatty-acyl-phospholipid synthase
MRRFPDLFTVAKEWTWNGLHYERTAEDRLLNFDIQRDPIRRILKPVYGHDVAVWERQWPLFLLATVGLFGHAGGSEWGVMRGRLLPTRE